ncbi:MAG: starch-binding protein [Lachnospiraceae bacterium]|nr:starch-binding protein [Lachnospiraceae bacterium]
MKTMRTANKKGIQTGRKKVYKRLGLAGVGFVCLLAVMMGVFWYRNSQQPSYAADDEAWRPIDLEDMVDPVNHTEGTDDPKELTTARATFYDIYSDSQVWDSTNGGYYTSVQPITDGAGKDKNGVDIITNTFTRFNYELATSLNGNNKEYQHMYDHDTTDHVEGVYPLYCGLTWPAKFKRNDGISYTGPQDPKDDDTVYMNNQRWGNLTSIPTFGSWFAAANTNQFSNDGDNGEKVSILGISGTAKGAAAQGLVNRQLDENGNITIGHGEYKRVLPFFDKTYLEKSYTGKVGGGTNDTTIENKIRNATFYVQVSKNDFNGHSRPYLYVFSGGKEYTAEFPGDLMDDYGDYYVYCRNDISSATVILNEGSDKSKLVEQTLSGYNEWKWKAYNPNGVDGFIPCSKPSLPPLPTEDSTAGTTPSLVSHGKVVSNIAFPFRKGGKKDTGLKIRVSKSVWKSSFPNNTPHVYLEGYKSWPGYELEEEGGYYVYTNPNITGKVQVIINNGSSNWQDPPDKQGFYTISGSVEYDKTAKAFYDTSRVYFSNSKLKLRVKASEFNNVAPYVYLYYDDVNKVNAWPGEKMTREGDYYVYNASNIKNTVNIIFTDGKGAKAGGWQEPSAGGYQIPGSGTIDFDRYNKKYTTTTEDKLGEETDPDYYYFDSYTDVVRLNEDNKKVDYYYNDNSQIVQDSDGINGFFPYNTASDPKTALNYVHGVKMELNFNMTKDGKIKGKPIEFAFTGDDDLWVFVDGYLVLDIGGAHIPISGNINFAEKKATVDVVKTQAAFADKYRDGNYNKNDGDEKGFEENVVYDFGKDSGEKLYEILSDTARNHTLTIFYMERGKGNSNLKIKFNLPQISTLSVGNEVDASDVNKSLQTDALWEACNQHQFEYVLQNKGTDDAGYDNSITEDIALTGRNIFEPIGMAAYRKKVTSKDGTAQRLRFFTFTNTNYYSMVVGGTNTNLPRLDGTGDGENNPIVVDGCATIDGQKYVFLGWTTDENYREHWDEIQNNTYTGTCPEILAAGTTVPVTESKDYYAVWVKKDLTISYYDETDVDIPIGYAKTGSNGEAQIGHETLDMKNYLNQSLPYWNNGDLGSKVTETNKQRTNWKTDDTRKGFKLNGWRLSKTEADKGNELISGSYFPLCNVKLYADWTRTDYRVQFQAENVEKIKKESGTTNADGDTWKSDIVYFPKGETYKGYLPYITEESNVDDFKITADGSTGRTYFDFTSLPVKENHAIVKWEQDDEEQTTYRTTKLVEDGKSLYPEVWTFRDGDVVFKGEWKRITSSITYSPGTCPGNSNLNWKPVKKKYTNGQTIYSPGVTELFGGGDTGEWNIVGWEKDGKKVSFPYTITEGDVNWTAVWEKVTGEVTYSFNNGTIQGMEDYQKVAKMGSSIERITLEGMGSDAPYDSDGSEGEEGSHTTYYIKAKGKAYVIKGWRDSSGNKINSTTKLTEEDTTVTAISKEVHTTLNITVVVKNEDKDLWNDAKALKNGWKKKETASGAIWTIDTELVPGESFFSYFDPKKGSLKEVLYGAVNTGHNVNKKLQYGEISYPGTTFSWENKDAKVPYTADSHKCIVTSNWIQEKATVTYAFMDPNEPDINKARIIGYQAYQVSDGNVSLPKSGDILLNADGGTDDETAKVPEISGYKLSGWYTSNLMPVTEVTADMNNTILYTAWEPEKTDSATQTQNISANTAAKSVTSVTQKKTKGTMRLFSFSSMGGYAPFGNELYQLDDLLVDGMATGRTNSQGQFRLTYDQAASFMNCFSKDSAMILKETNNLYLTGGSTVGRDTMYDTVWELRDVHGYITDRNSKNKDLKHMPVVDTTNKEAVVYDGRVDDAKKGAFKFGNENEAQGISYALSLRALFTHKIKTADLTITKKLTDTAASVAFRKGEQDLDYTFKVTFKNIFGNTGSNDKLLYEGTYKKLDKYGNYVRENNKIKEYTATDGKILLKNGETAVISGIPVMTEYDIEEEDTYGKKDAYVLSCAEEIIAKGLAGKDKKYAVSEVDDGNKQYLYDHEGTGHTKVVQDNGAALEGKKLGDFKNGDKTVINIEHTFSGKVEKAGYTYNYVAENEVLIDGITLSIDKIIDEFYYDDNDRFYEDVKYQDLTHAKQTFIFKIKYIPVDENGNPTSEKKEFEEVVTFDPEDTTLEIVPLPTNLQTTDKKKGYKKTVVVLGLEPGYYEISEDEEWSWKYDLMETNERVQKDGIGVSVYSAGGNRETSKNDKSKPKKRYRCYIRGLREDITGDNKSYDGEQYKLLDKAEEPKVSFINMKVADERKDVLGDTDIKTNKVAPPTPTPNPNKYNKIVLDKTHDGKKLLVGESIPLPIVKAERKDGTVEILEANKVTWSVSDSNCVERNGTTLEAKKEGSNITITASFTDGDGKTKYTDFITINVLAASRLPLYGDTKIPYKLIFSSQKSGNPNNPATYAVDGNSDTLWITNTGEYGTDTYWGLVFKDAKGKNTTRKINKVSVKLRRENCNRTVKVYAFTSVDDTQPSGFTEMEIGTKTFEHDGTVREENGAIQGGDSLNFNIPIGNYYGIKVVMLNRSGGTAWPAIAEVEIYGKTDN